MSGAEPPWQWRNAYEQPFLTDVHQLLAWGYGDARSQIGPAQEEQEITGLIVEAMRARLSDVSTEARFDRYSVREGPPVPGDGRLGKRRRRVDIILESASTRPRREFAFEAKLLRRNGFPIGLYTGDDGLQCYVRGVYAGSSPAAAMVGYVQTDSPDRWYGELQRKLDGDGCSGLCVDQKLSRCAVISSLPHEWVSVHRRNGLGLITVFHIFLDCC